MLLHGSQFVCGTVKHASKTFLVTHWVILEFLVGEVTLLTVNAIVQAEYVQFDIMGTSITTFL